MWETTMRIEQSAVVRGEPGQLWALLSSPEAWCLRAVATFMFAVPEAQALRLYIGPTRRGIGTVLFEVRDEVPGATIRLRALPGGRQEFTLSVAAGRRGTAKATVPLTEVVPRQQLINFEHRRRNDIKAWLTAVRAVIEGRARWPDVWAATGQPALRLMNCGRRARNSSRAFGLTPLTPAPLAARPTRDWLPCSAAARGANGCATVVAPSQSRYSAPSAVSAASISGERAIRAATPAATTAVRAT